MSEQHWESVHAGKAHDDVSWWQELDDVWIDLVDRTGLPPEARVVDVGSGSSVFVDALIERGFSDITLVDVSATALVRTLDRVRAQYGERADGVRTVVADVTTLRLDPPVDLWFDRAVFHFLTEEEDRQAYAEALQASLRPGGFAVVATFALDGPETCSGLPVQRYDADGLRAALGVPFWPGRAEKRVHVTPWGTRQPFTIVAVQRPSGL